MGSSVALASILQTPEIQSGESHFSLSLFYIKGERKGRIQHYHENNMARHWVSTVQIRS